MPESDINPTLGQTLLGTGASADPATNEEWEKIQAAAARLAEDAARGSIPSRPDEPEDQLKLASSNARIE